MTREDLCTMLRRTLNDLEEAEAVVMASKAYTEALRRRVSTLTKQLEVLDGD